MPEDVPRSLGGRGTTSDSALTGLTSNAGQLELQDGASLDGVFRHYTGGNLDDNTESGGIRDVRRARRTARRLG